MSTQRYVGKLDPVVVIDGFPSCRWCTQPVPKPRRTLCSEECAHQLRLRQSGSYLRRCVYQRDKGVCSICNVDTKRIAKAALLLSGAEREVYLKDHCISHRKIKKTGIWDADHILAVKDGGGMCGLENMRTLCLSCHKKITFI